MNKKILKNTIIPSTVCLIMGFAVGAFVFSDVVAGKIEKVTSASPKEIRQGQVRFTNRLLECDAGQEALTNPLGVSKFEIEKLVDQRIEEGRATQVSVYFRDLNNGPWFGIKEKEEFMGGSLLKVPLLMAYLKEAESHPEILQARIKYKVKNTNVSQYFTPSKEIEEGKEYTVEELLSAMIKYSDNNAADLLGSHINPEKITNTFLALGIGLPDFSKPYPTSVRTYAGFFRVLYNASYLNIEMSEKALDLLSQAEFSEGIRKSIPANISLAHKFGIREISGITDKQLHDCGIVYYPEHPYVLCVMTRGDDFNELAGVLSDISSAVYNQIDVQVH